MAFPYSDHVPNKNGAKCSQTFYSLQRHFCVLALSFPGKDALVTIYSSIYNQHLKMNKFSMAIQKASHSLIDAALALHQRVSQVFLPTAIKFHYVFNLRDLSNIFQVSFDPDSTKHIKLGRNYSKMLKYQRLCPINLNLRDMLVIFNVEDVCKHNQFTLTYCVSNFPVYFFRNSFAYIRSFMQGILYAGPDCIKNVGDAVKLWLHEACRVYKDKLVDDKDMSNFDEISMDIAKKFFEVSALMDSVWLCSLINILQLTSDVPAILAMCQRNWRCASDTGVVPGILATTKQA